jgi:hypothetical protein
MLLAVYAFVSAGLVYFLTARMSRASAHGYRFRLSDVTAFDEARGVLEMSARATANQLMGKRSGLQLRLKIRDPAALLGHIPLK